MCTFNGAPFLQEQLQSIAAQSRLPDELVVCDDQSTDESVEAIREFARRAPFPVRVSINESRLGATKNFEKAIGLCRGEIIALSDQDDIWHTEKLNRLSEVLEQNVHVGAVFSNAKMIDHESRPLAGTLWSSFLFNSNERKKFERGKGLRVLLKHGTVTGATMAFRNRFRDLVLPIPAAQVHDHWIAVLIASVSQLLPIERTLMNYRRHLTQQIGPGNGESLSEAIEIAKRAGRDHYLEEVVRFNQICERIIDLSGTFRPHSDALSMIRQKINHRKTRGSLPRSRFLRVPLLLREIATRRYWRYSNGFGSVAKDILV